MAVTETPLAFVFVSRILYNALIFCKQRMKKTLLVISIVVIVSAVAGLYFFTQKTSTDTNITQDNALANNSLATNAKSASAEQRYQGDGFSLLRPQGWIEGQIPSTLVSFHNNSETHPDGSAAAKINFKSYIAVSFDNLQGKTLEDIHTLTVNNITAAIPSAKVFATSDETVGGQPAKFSAMELNQQDVDYTVLLVLIGGGDKYYSLSFNTTTEKWIASKDEFYRIARSFSIK